VDVRDQRKSGVPDQPAVLVVDIPDLEVQQQPPDRASGTLRHGWVVELENGQLVGVLAVAAQADVPVGVERHPEPEVLDVEIPQQRDLVCGDGDDRVEAGQIHGRTPSVCYIQTVCV